MTHLLKLLVRASWLPTVLCVGVIGAVHFHVSFVDIVVAIILAIIIFLIVDASIWLADKFGWFQ